MMTLYSGTTDPFSQRCIVLHEKGMDFQIIDVDLDHKPEDLAVMNLYNQVPVLVERDLVLHESNIINEYIDERFPHPQLMPADPVMRARARLFLHRFEKELFVHIDALKATTRRTPSARWSATAADHAGVRQAQVHAGRRLPDARRGHHARSCGSWTTTASRCLQAAPRDEEYNAERLFPRLAFPGGADVGRTRSAAVRARAGTSVTGVAGELSQSGNSKERPLLLPLPDALPGHP